MKLAQMLAVRTDRQLMKVRRAAVIFVAGIITASCSEKSTPDRQKDATTSQAPNEPAGELVRAAEAETGGGELQPSEDQIGEDCAAFVRSTKVVPARGAGAECPACPAGGTDVLSFRSMDTDAISCTGDMCTVVVTMRAVFNPGSGKTIAGGLTAWILPEQRSAYLDGQTPSDEQVYHVQIIYKRCAEGWCAIEFDRATGR